MNENRSMSFLKCMQTIAKIHFHFITNCQKMKLSCCLIIALLTDSSLGLFFGNWGYGSSGYGYGITYQLYTRRNPVNGQPLIIGNRNSVAYSNYDSNKPTR